jgi:hypothetical protein
LTWLGSGSYASFMMNGRCLCGAVTFSAERVETEHHACHCGMCRRWSGGSAFFAAEAQGVSFTSQSSPSVDTRPATEQLGRYESSDWAERGFCKNCGTTLFYFLKPTGMYLVSVGAFDDQRPFRLVREICIDQKPAGYAYAGDHPRWTEAETFARLTPQEQP